MRTAVSEVWELGNYVLLKLLGPVHNDDAVYIMNYVLKWVESGTVTDHMYVAKIRSAVNGLIQVVDVLGKGIGRRKPSPHCGSTGKLTKNKNPPVLLHLASVDLLVLAPSLLAHSQIPVRSRLVPRQMIMLLSSTLSVITLVTSSVPSSTH